MIEYGEALGRLVEAAGALETETVDAAAAHGRFCAEAVRSPASLPPFANSAMDGFALATGGGGLPAGTRRQVAGSVAAGDTPSNPDGAPSDAAWEIMTGAPVPAGLDAVIPVEKVRIEEERAGRPSRIQLEAAVAAGDNVRSAGADVREGDPMMAPGRRVGAAESMALAAVGIGRLRVFREPLARVLCTGPELVDDPDEPLSPGRIRNSNGPFLQACLEQLGVRVTANLTLGDRVEPFVEEIGRARSEGAKLVVSTGAVSMGRHDFVPEALERVGARVLFHRVAIRPGKPLLGAVLPGGALFLGLPGNPISAAVGARFFLKPVLDSLRLRGPEAPWRLPLAGGATTRPGLRHFLRVRLETDPEGGPVARALPLQQSFRIAPLLEAHAWAVIPEETEAVPDGEVVDVFALEGEMPASVT